MVPSSQYLPVTRNYSEPFVASILVASVCYLSVLSLLNAQGILEATPVVLGLAELLIYGGCFFVLRRSIHPILLIVPCFIAAWLCLAWLLRGEIDPKGARDLLIPMLFLSLGRRVANTAFADRVIRLVLQIVLLAALAEMFFMDFYASLFNTLQFYVNTGAAYEDQAMFKGQMLTLNAFRPDGIGRTILPMVFGAHRVSSLLMEPVSLGNFALLILGWGLSKEHSEFRQNAFFFWGAAALIALADSRFALLASGLVLLLRALPARLTNRLSVFFPLLGITMLFYVAILLPSHGDNLMGRLSRSGEALLDLSALMWFGLSGRIPGFWDAGYANVISRFGLPLFGLLLFGLVLLPTPDQRAMRFRAFVLLYGSMILMVSGTSFFALKTAGLMWFMLGILSAVQKTETLARVVHPVVQRSGVAGRARSVA